MPYHYACSFQSTCLVWLYPHSHIEQFKNNGAGITGCLVSFETLSREYV